MQVDTPTSRQPDRGPQGPTGPTPDRGGMRMDGLARLVVGGLYLILFAFVIAPLIFTVGLILGVIDVVWQILTGREGIAPMNLWTSAWNAQYDNALWALSGQGEFELTIFG